MKRISQKGESIEQAAQFREVIEAGRGNDWGKFQSGIGGIIKNALDSWQLPLPPQDLSFTGFYQLRRAVRATMVALAFHNAHPLALIVRAWKGDKESVLELVKIDKLFLQDKATAGVIRNAGLKNDQWFMKLLARAQSHEPRLHRRDLIHIDLNFVFFLEITGQQLPRIDELHRLLDPTGTVFPGSFSFEKGLERQRNAFKTKFAEMDSQVPAITNFYKANSSPKS